ncbi:MAG TPA: acyl-CoA dehydrogenase [Acetobacteraceae bacterium]|nr:acyl-CoA dehydrogenase [Acetobacteraceae bacterium]
MLDTTSSSALLARVAALVPAWTEAAQADERRVPEAELGALRVAGGLLAPAPVRCGGLGIGTEPDGAAAALRLLRLIGRANLSLGRIFEGHVNALKLVARYGGAAQMEHAVADAAAGHLFAIWATDGSEPVRIEGRQLHGGKTFCSAAAQATRPVITAKAEGGSEQMLLIPLAPGERVGAQRFETHGMQACGTGVVDFTGIAVDATVLIGQPGDYLRQPEFSAGAWRASAVACGGLDALVAETREQLVRRGRHNDPHQQARLGAMLIAQETASLWIGKAARIAEGEEAADGDIAEYVNLARIAIETACLDAMRLVQRSLGLAALMRPNPVERLLRDLATYLRQPAPDIALTEAAAWFSTRDLPDEP